MQKEIEQHQSQIEDLEGRLGEALQGVSCEKSTSPVIASMRRLQVCLDRTVETASSMQGLLHTRERDLRRSQLKISALEAQILLSNDNPQASPPSIADPSTLLDEQS